MNNRYLKINNQMGGITKIFQIDLTNRSYQNFDRI
jgi:hypothetical protein